MDSTQKGNILRQLLTPFMEWLFDVTPTAPKERAVKMWDMYESVYMQLDRMGYYLENWYAENGETFAVAVKDSQLYRFSTTMTDDGVTLGDPVQVAIRFEERQKPNLTIIRQADGKVRWIASPAAVATLNRDAQIDSTKLLNDFVRRIKSGKTKFPVLRFFHGGDVLNMGVTDVVEVDDYCLVMSGTFDDSELAEYMIRELETNPDYWGTSIGFMPRSEPTIERMSGIEIPVYEEGELIEVSVLPEKLACHFMTRIGITRKTMSQALIDALTKVTGDVKIAERIASGVDDVNRSIKETGMIARQEAPAEQPAAAQATVLEIDDTVIAAVLDKFVNSENYRNLESRITTIEGSQTELARAIQGQVDANKQLVEELRQFRGVVDKRVAPLERDEVTRQTDIIASMPGANLQRVVVRPTQPNAQTEVIPLEPAYEQRAQATLERLKRRV